MRVYVRAKPEGREDIEEGGGGGTGAIAEEALPARRVGSVIGVRVTHGAGPVFAITSGKGGNRFAAK